MWFKGLEVPWEAECSRCCTCCRDFYLPISPRGIQEMRDTGGTYTAKVDPYSHYRLGGKQKVGPIRQWEIIVDMVIPLKPARERFTGKFGPGYRYTCRYFTEQTEDGKPGCSIYDRRPEMCRGFPYGRMVVDDSYNSCVWHTSKRPVELVGEKFDALVGEVYAKESV